MRGIKTLRLITIQPNMEHKTKTSRKNIKDFLMKNVFHFMLKVWKCVRWPHYSLLICFVRLYRSQKQLFYIYIFNFFFLNLLPEYFKFEFSFPKSWDFSETCLKPLCLVRHKTTFWQQITLYLTVFTM